MFFRAHTQETAAALGLVGWVRNAPDGAVEVVAEGNRDRLEKLLAWCRRGPNMAQVTSVEESWEPASRQFTQFRITY